MAAASSRSVGVGDLGTEVLAAAGQAAQRQPGRRGGIGQLVGGLQCRGGADQRGAG